MREIEFRGKAKNKKCWVFGDLIHNENGYAIIERKGGCIKVKPETIGQYTGLKDKNGTKIFEGDIVKKAYYDKPRSSKVKTKELIGIVKWIELKTSRGVYKADFDVEIIDYELHKKYRCWDWSRFCDCEVIGNIYDNPELIQQQDKE